MFCFHKGKNFISNKFDGKMTEKVLAFQKNENMSEKLGVLKQTNALLMPSDVINM